ncbi:MAG: hypothetical protein DRP64_16945, partial [Verrucomicrobia bacterium]
MRTQSDSVDHIIAAKGRAVASFVAFGRGEAMPAHPLEVHLELTDACNQQCVMCPSFSAFGGARRTEPGFLDFDAARQAINELAGPALMVNVSGFGEPTLHPRFFEILDLLAGQRVMTEFFTNGKNLDDAMLEKFVEKKVHRIMVSISGSTAEQYESVYLGGRFESLLDTLKRIHQCKQRRQSSYPKVVINSLSFRHHVASLDSFVELMAGCGVDRINLTPLVEHPADLVPLAGHAVPLGSLAGNPVASRAGRVARRHGIELAIHPSLMKTTNRLEQEDLPKVELSSFKGLARRAQMKGRLRIHRGDSQCVIDPIGDSIEQVRGLLGVRRFENEEQSSFVCLEPFTTLYVRRSGRVKACCFMRDDTPALGNIFDSSVSEIWNGNGFQTVREAVVNHEYPMVSCGNCLGHGQAPKTHRLDTLVQEYTLWHDECSGSQLRDGGAEM